MSLDKRPILQDILSILVFLLTLEILLRLNGVFDLSYQSYLNHKRVSAGHVYTIMCIGDSNTYLGGENSYPSQLEKILNERTGGLKFKVINQGLPAAPSKVIMDSFEPWLGKYSPDMVVSMMGANDRHPIVLSPNQKNFFKFLAPLRSLKIYKLFEGIVIKIKDHVRSWVPGQPAPKPNVPPPTPFKVVPKKYVQLLMLGLDAKNNGNCDAAEYILTNLLGDPDLDITFQQRVDSELRQCYMQQKKYPELMDTLRFNFNIWDYDVGSTDNVRELCTTGQAKEEVIGLLTDLIALYPKSVALNGLLGACYAEYGESALAAPYLQKIKQMRSLGDMAILKQDYLKLHRILKQHKIKGVYVQYPLRDVNDLKRLLSAEDDYDKMIFVDNEGPFQEALKPDQYYTYFTDRNYDDMGHCTPLGNHILAGNIADAILKYLRINSIRDSSLSSE